MGKFENQKRSQSLRGIANHLRKNAKYVVVGMHRGLQPCCIPSCYVYCFESGIHRGLGPTIFELAFRHADMMGSVSAHEKATNFLMEANGRFDLLRSCPV